jgi:hypothetical protein
MAMQYESLFETPTNSYSNAELEHEWEHSMEMQNEWEANPYSNPELENEWETNAYSNSYSNPEFTNEWETSMEMQNEWEANPYGNPELENAWESNPYSNPEFENEWETNPYSNSEMNPEGEFFFKRLASFAKKRLLPLARKMAPNLARTLLGMIPGVGAIAGPLAGKLTSALLQEAEMEVAQLEANFFGTNEAEAEVANHEVAYEAALTEFLAAQAAEASTESESESAIAASLPITITIMGGKRALRPVIPVMTQATGQLAKAMRQQGPAGRQLLRTIPTIQRQTVATLKAAARAGQPINSTTALRAMANATNRVLSNPQAVQKAVVRNAVLRQRTAPPNPRRMAAPCPKCAAAGR